ncbi:hypothetical protein [Pseudomonas putida]
MATPYRKGQVLHSVFAAASTKAELLITSANDQVALDSGTIKIVITPSKTAKKPKTLGPNEYYVDEYFYPVA